MKLSHSSSPLMAAANKPSINVAELAILALALLPSSLPCSSAYRQVSSIGSPWKLERKAKSVAPLPDHRSESAIPQRSQVIHMHAKVSSTLKTETVYVLGKQKLSEVLSTDCCPYCVLGWLLKSSFWGSHHELCVIMGISYIIFPTIHIYTPA